MMKNFMTSGALSRGKKPKGDSGGKGSAPDPGEEVVRDLGEGKSSGMRPAPDPNPCDAKDCGGRPESIETLGSKGS
jgi:hypothetical protein